MGKGEGKKGGGVVGMGPDERGTQGGRGNVRVREKQGFSYREPGNLGPQQRPLRK